MKNVVRVEVCSISNKVLRLFKHSEWFEILEGKKTRLDECRGRAFQLMRVISMIRVRDLDEDLDDNLGRFVLA